MVNYSNDESMEYSDELANTPANRIINGGDLKRQGKWKRITCRGY